ncbi:hypothetical protein EJ03DRAFT_209376 [Teratosphaeria nubilosa]|uniref:Uncharacterized protein n=1 Tax=Teratosphaeria nubilosa TaxID=161662 RepID=A0A6G1KYU9_9PEZI|nr:hypothetical protein EJ03DRAFT_209376 [Teratosphaeria nubilosa]
MLRRGTSVRHRSKARRHQQHMHSLLTSVCSTFHLLPVDHASHASTSFVRTAPQSSSLASANERDQSARRRGGCNSERSGPGHILTARSAARGLLALGRSLSGP